MTKRRKKLSTEAQFALQNVIASAFIEIDNTISEINLNAHFTKKEELLDAGTIRGLELAKRILSEL